MQKSQVKVNIYNHINLELLARKLFNFIWSKLKPFSTLTCLQPQFFAHSKGHTHEDRPGHVQLLKIIFLCAFLRAYGKVFYDSKRANGQPAGVGSEFHSFGRSTPVCAADIPYVHPPIWTHKYVLIFHSPYRRLKSREGPRVAGALRQQQWHEIQDRVMIMKVF